VRDPVRNNVLRPDWMKLGRGVRRAVSVSSFVP
jgi:hypothetical protein